MTSDYDNAFASVGNGAIDWRRLEDQLQQNEALRSHDRAQPTGPMDGEELFNPESDPWAWDYKPWPAPKLTTIPDATGYSLRSETLINDTADQIFGVK